MWPDRLRRFLSDLTDILASPVHVAAGNGTELPAGDVNRSIEGICPLLCAVMSGELERV